jgi:site-specific recombinase XerD
MRVIFPKGISPEIKPGCQEKFLAFQENACMLAIPSHVQTQFQPYLKDRNIPIRMQGPYLKWLRYYLDFCQKYHVPQDQYESLSRFLEKLQEKQQTEAQRAQAAQAIAVYYDFIQAGKMQNVSLGDHSSGNFDADGNFAQHEMGLDEGIQRDPAHKETFILHTVEARLADASNCPLNGNSQDAPASGQTQPLTGASWKVEYASLAQTLMNRDYPERTAKAYTRWVRKFQAFLRSKPPKMLSPEDASAFLASLQKEERLPVSQQNQACDALLLLYTYVLEKPCQLTRVIRQPADQPLRTGRGASWAAEYTELTNAITMRHYSSRTLKTYTQWARKFQAFARSKAPESLSPEDVKEFLTFLAVKRQVSASSQNQAFNALQANYDIRTIQELLGHSDLRTTMIYTHTVKSVTLKEAKSPLDLWGMTPEA